MVRKRMVSLLFAFFVLLASGAVAQADGSTETLSEGGTVTPYYQHISFVGASLSIGQWGRAVSSGDVYVSDEHNSTLTIKLQRLNGGIWATVESWSESFSGKAIMLLKR
ncbi:hypothetical protein [Paenibacillus sp. YN15]|uniref:hypothetical protein n=1 Tax=Paenibacillus sp. YN15 TaxID=1742774 RepID=UPI000DCD2BA6|nr:hypothetical protein [Paenibacillus sp. YN15]RAV06448.1 hypothetical protein DQG13_01025 [Paenibacillus sp. YN15]